MTAAEVAAAAAATVIAVLPLARATGAPPAQGTAGPRKCGAARRRRRTQRKLLLRLLLVPMLLVLPLLLLVPGHGSMAKTSHPLPPLPPPIGSWAAPWLD